MEELIVVDNNNITLKQEFINKLVELELESKKIKEIQDKYKKALLEEMENKNIIKIENDDLLINYIASTSRETFDTKTFKEEYSDLYDEYVKITEVKPSIRIKVK